MRATTIESVCLFFFLFFSRAIFASAPRHTRRFQCDTFWLRTAAIRHISIRFAHEYPGHRGARMNMQRYKPRFIYKYDAGRSILPRRSRGENRVRFTVEIHKIAPTTLGKSRIHDHIKLKRPEISPFIALSYKKKK